MRITALALLVVAALAPALGAQEAPRPCEIRGHLSVPDVHVVPARGSIRVVTIEDRDVRVTPLGRGRFAVRTHGGGARVEGHTQAAIPIALAAETMLAGVARVAGGTPVDGIEPHGEALRGSLPIDDGVSLERVTLRCRELAAAAPTAAARDAVPVTRGPVWHARIVGLRVRAAPTDEAIPVMVVTTPEARAQIAWIERERQPAWVRVEAALAHASVAGWVRDTELTLP